MVRPRHFPGASGTFWVYQTLRSWLGLYHARSQDGNEFLDFYAFLSHAVAIPQGHRAILKTIKIYREAERGAHFVLAAVAAAYGPCFIIEGRVVFIHQLVDFLRFFHQFGPILSSGKTATLIGAMAGLNFMTVRNS